MFISAGNRGRWPASVKLVTLPILRLSTRCRQTPAMENLLDVSADNKSIASKHRLHAKTRTSVVQTVEAWFSGEGPAVESSSSRVMLIHGPAGCGKTCLAADLCRRYSGRKKLVAGHFFHWRPQRPDHNCAVTVLLGLAHRMCHLLNGYILLRLLHCDCCFSTFYLEADLPLKACTQRQN